MVKRRGDETQCSCLHSDNFGPLCITIMGRLGLTALGDHVAEPSEESPMDVSLDEQELMDCIHQAYSRKYEDQEEHQNTQREESAVKRRKTSRRNTGKVNKIKASTLPQKERLEPPTSPLRIKLTFARTRLRAAQLFRAGNKLFPEASKCERPDRRGDLRTYSDLILEGSPTSSSSHPLPSPACQPGYPWVWAREQLSLIGPIKSDKPSLSRNTFPGGLPKQGQDERALLKGTRRHQQHQFDSSQLRS